MTTPLERQWDWVARLRAFFAAEMGRPTAWGSRDCCLWPCTAIETMTGVDPGRYFRGRYRTRAGAMQSLRGFLRKRGLAPQPSGMVEEVAAILAAEHAMPEVAPSFAQRGDLVLARVDSPAGTGDALAIVDLTGREAVTHMDDELVTFDVLASRRAWRV